MTITPTSTLGTLVLAALALQPVHAAAQGARSTIPAPAPTRPAATAPAPAPAPAGTSTPRSTTAGRPWNEQEYRLGPGDKLRIEVYGEPQLSQSLQVRPDGMITLPLAGDIVAAGRTSNELRDAVAAGLKDYVKNPVVTSIVQEANAAQVHVIGEVANPGVQVLQGPLTVLQVLAQAGGLMEFAKQRDIRILRKTSTGVRTIEFDYKDAINGRTAPTYVEPGDTIIVP
jgi:polysaccharide export outer membrane protein